MYCASFTALSAIKLFACVQDMRRTRNGAQHDKPRADDRGHCIYNFYIGKLKAKLEQLFDSDPDPAMLLDNVAAVLLEHATVWPRTSLTWKMTSDPRCICRWKDQLSMIKPELAFVIIFTSNFAAPLLAFIAGRKWPSCRKTLHFLALVWIVLSVYVCDRVTFTPAMTTVDDSYEPDEVKQFLAIVAVLLQQLAILVTYLAWYVCRAFVKRLRASRREA